MTIAGKADVSAAGNTTDNETNKPVETEAVATKSVAQEEPSDETSITTGDESMSKTEPTEVSPATAVHEAEVPADSKRGNWTVVSVVIGISAAAAGIAILKITKIL